MKSIVGEQFYLTRLGNEFLKNIQPTEEQIRNVLKKTLKDYNMDDNKEVEDKWVKFIMNQVDSEDYPENDKDEFSLEEQAVFSLLKEN